MAVDPVQVNALSNLVGTLVWPAVALILAFLFRRAVRDFLAREEVDVTGPVGIKISAKGKTAAASALVQASASRNEGAIDLSQAETEVEAVASDVGSLGRSPQVLWVDDRPSNNRYERAALHSLGMFVELSVSTEDALVKVAAHGRYDVIISDMGRPPDDRAGYTLLGALRLRGDATPFVIYAASRDPEHFDESIRQGAVGCTNRPSELIEMVSNALRSTAVGH